VEPRLSVPNQPRRLQALHPVSGFDAGGRNVTALPNSFDFGDILKFGTLGAGIGCAKGGDFAHIVGWNTKSAPCIGGARRGCN
jgi:hypothetical protein